MRLPVQRYAFAILMVCLTLAGHARAFQPATAPAGADDGGGVPPVPDVEMKPTDVGVRFTPGMARAISGQFVRQMKPHYELSDDQARAINDIMTKQIMRLAHDAQTAGRDSIEFMMETMIENDGTFPPQAAKTFGKTIQPVIPQLDRFFTDTAQQVSGQMTLAQRLRFTADAAPVVAGLVMFKNQMQRWEKGQVGRGPNMFFDTPQDAPASQEADPNEPVEVTRARRQADQNIQWSIDRTQEQWRQYVDRAIAYYQLDAGQQKSARGVLKDAQDRVATVKTPAWREKVRANRMKLYLTYQSASDLSNGPWMFRIENEYEQMIKPVNDLSADLKRRVDALPTTSQRAAAEARARQQFEKLGVTLTRS